ncbi:non-ribosomal peptide synthetase [Streptomyces sparsogenes DSM 40356]|uniref:Non-ribosomal peptide synthetase n=1 Tax=Streptomyces sparsogenes DSM 40356 TaxID=1331668 RepID=A0A1R1S9X2_9ACTN|nr:non-ribosomal peptide synthetase [Streptomyces sparsogenes DSM 40356]
MPDTAPVPDPPRSLVDMFEATAARHPDRPAVGDGELTLTYRQLSERSDALAAYLEERGVTTEDRVAVYRPRSAELFVAILGILKARAAYVAVDIRYPDKRRDLMIERSGAKAVITAPGWAGRLAHLGADVIEWHGEPAGPSRPAGPWPAPDNAACVLFTSGSTGVPKAFVLEHGNLLAFARNPVMPELLPTDRTSQIASVSFDAFHFETWCSFAYGAQIVVMPSMPELLASDVRRELESRRISVMIAPTMAFNHLGRESPETFSSLRVLQVGGGVMHAAACRDVLDGGFKGSLWNLYGPAETTTGCSVHQVEAVGPGEDSVPIGRPLEGFRLYVLDADRRPVPTGEPGELYVGGPGVSRGYIDQPELTERRYHPDPFAADGSRMYATGDLVRERPDGVFEYIGREDDQVKIRGYRVEPADVERALSNHPAVKEAVVVVTGTGLDLSLVAFAAADDGLTPQELTRYAQRELPDFMVPSRVLVLPMLPANENGKRDVAALEQLLADDLHRRTEVSPPAEGTQRYLADLWQELLGAERIGAEDDFFGVGGNSLLAYRTRQRLQRDLGISIGFREIINHPVLSDLAARIDATRADGPGREA